MILQCFYQTISARALFSRYYERSIFIFVIFFFSVIRYITHEDRQIERAWERIYLMKYLYQSVVRENWFDWNAYIKVTLEDFIRPRKSFCLPVTGDYPVIVKPCRGRLELLLRKYLWSAYDSVSSSFLISIKDIFFSLRCLTLIAARHWRRIWPFFNKCNANRGIIIRGIIISVLWWLVIYGSTYGLPVILSTLIRSISTRHTIKSLKIKKWIKVRLKIYPLFVHHRWLCTPSGQNTDSIICSIFRNQTPFGITFHTH